jgi:ABC-type branched-subunit amino acid transport system substrate-binding protein
MDIYCTRPRCEQPLNSFADLDSSKFLKPIHQRHCISCGMPLILDGRYLPVKLLQRDELSATFLACDLHTPKLNRRKIEQLQLDPNFNPAQVEIATRLFCREAEVLEKLGEHPKIPRLFASLEIISTASPAHPQQKFFYLVQEYIEGENLETELLAKGKLTEPEVVLILREIARILEFVHFQDKIHQNIKPSNIIRDLQGKIYLIGFGAIKHLVAEIAYLTVELPERSLASVFTPKSAPEKHHLGPEIYPSSDLYSLAVTCLNLLTGTQPEYLLDPNTNTWQWRTVDLQVSNSLADILDQMLQQLPSARFASARDVLDALDTSLGTPILSIPATSISTAILPAFSSLRLEASDEDAFQFDDDFLQLDDSFLQLDRDIFEVDDRLLQLDKNSLVLGSAPLQIIPRPIVKDQKPWLIGGALATGVIGLIAMIIPKLLMSSPALPVATDSISKRSSMGERILLSFEGNRDTEKFKELKKAGVLAIASRNYPEAVAKLRLALIENPNSPETRIYLNNALIGNNKSYVIATAAPIARSIDRASEMLRGFAQAQAELNQIGGVNEAKIKLKIIDDSDDPKVINSIATALVKQPEILGIAGHSRNDVTMKAAKIYNENELAFVAPISTANNLTSSSKPYVFRTNSRGDAIAQQLVNRLIDRERKQKVAIFYAPNISYTDEFKTQFFNKLVARGGEVVGTFPFSTLALSTASPPTTFNADEFLAKVNKMGVEAVLLLPVGSSNRDALKILKLRASKYPKLSILSDTALYNLNTLKAGRETEGLVLSVPWQESESTPQFSTGASQLWKTQVNWATATSYNAVKALGTAIKVQEPPTRAGVMKILAESDFMGAAGRFQFTKGELTGRSILVQVSKTPLNYRYSSGKGYDFMPIE